MSTTLADLLAQGQSHHQAGRLADARTLYRQALEAAPDHPAPMFLLAQIEAAEGKLTDAIALYRTVLARSPEKAKVGLALADTLQMAGAHADAVKAYADVLAIDPTNVAAMANKGRAHAALKQMELAASALNRAVDHAPDHASIRFARAQVRREMGDAAGGLADADMALSLGLDGADVHGTRGLLLEALGRDDDAVLAYRAALERQPTSLPALLNLGNVERRLGHRDTARQMYDRALAIAPGSPDILNNRAVLLKDMGRHGDALHDIQQAVAADPANPTLHVNHGAVLHDVMQLAAAVGAFDRALALDPTLSSAHTNRAVVLKTLGRMDEAQASAEKAVALDPNDPQAHNVLGNVLAERHRDEAALAAYDAALALNADLPDTHNNRANALRELGRFAEAEAAYDRAIALDPSKPGWRLRRALVAPEILMDDAEIVRRRQHLVETLDALLTEDVRIADPYREVGLPNFALAYQARDDRDLQRRIARFYLDACPGLAWTAPHIAAPRPQEDGRIRLGICSRFLRDHTIGRLFGHLLGALPRDRFEVSLLRLAGRGDAMSRAFDALADRVVNIPDDLKLARETIAAQQLDILFYPDIGMDSLGYFLAFARLARVQCMSYGHPSTIGVPTMDYFLSAEAVEPADSAAHYTETLIALSRLPILYRRPDPPTEVTRARFGFPETGPLYVCPQNLIKFHPSFDAILIDLLDRDPQAHIVLLSAKAPAIDAVLRARIERTAGRTLGGRLIFQPRMPLEAFLALMAVADVLLDPPYFGGGNTSYEAFSLGTPVVTWPGPLMRGRLTYGAYRWMGIDDCVADTFDAYVEIAHRLAHDKSARTALSARIRERSAVLFDDMETVEELADFFTAAHAAARLGATLPRWTARARHD